MIPQENNTTLRSLLLVALGQLLLSAVMLAVYWALGYFSVKVLYSVAIGTGLSLLTFASTDAAAIDGLEASPLTMVSPGISSCGIRLPSIRA